MADFNIVKGGLKSGHQANIPSTGLGSSIGRTLAGGAHKVLQGLESIPAVGVGDLAFREIRKRVLGGTPSEAVFKATGTSPQALQPQSPAEDIGQTVLGVLPLAIGLGGASIPQIVGREIASTAAMKGVEALGGGTASQLLAGLLGGGAFTKGSHKIGRGVGKLLEESHPNISKYLSGGGTPEGLQQLAQKAETKYYDEANKLGGKITVAAPKYRRFLSDIEKEIEDTSALKPSQREDLKAKIEKYKSDFNLNAIKASDISKRQKEVNQSWDSGSHAYNQFITRINGGMQEAIERLKPDHSAWYKALEKGKGVHKALNYNQEVSKFLFNNPKTLTTITNPIVRGLVGSSAGGLLGGLPGLAIGIGGAIAYPKANEMIAFLQYPGARQVYGKMIKDMLSNNVNNFIKDAHKLNKLADKYESQPRSQQFAVLRGGKKKS